MKLSKENKRRKKHLVIRKKIFGTEARPRVCVFKSNLYFYAQIINDDAQKTIYSFSSMKLNDEFKKNNIKAAEKVGEEITKKAKELKITKIVFDRNGYIYHGKIKAFADKLREGGIQF